MKIFSFNNKVLCFTIYTKIFFHHTVSTEPSIVSCGAFRLTFLIVSNSFSILQCFFGVFLGGGGGVSSQNCLHKV